MIDKSLIRDFPPMTATLLSDHSGVFRVGTAEKRVVESDENSAMRALVELMRAEAAKSSRPVRVMVTDPTSITQLVVGVDGELEEEPVPAYAEVGATAPAPVSAVEAPEPEPVAQIEVPATVERPAEQAPVPTPVPASIPPAAAVSVPVEQAEPVAPQAGPAVVEPTSAWTVQPVDAGQPGVATTPEPVRRDLADAPSFLAPPTVGPARKGIAGVLNSFGFKVAPSAAELAEREDINAVSRHFPKRRTISVANQKGGANKTPTVVNLSSVFARFGGGGVAAWDNNETMGTLGWRTEQGGHDLSVLDLLAAAENLLSPGAERADLSRFVHHQPEDKYEVLRSAADGEHVVTAEEVDLVHRVLAKYYRLIVMDSGNSAGAPNWRRMIDLTDQLVVPTTTVEDKKESARLTLTAVSRVSEHGATLARNAVVIVSEAEAKDTATAQRYADDFRPYVREVVVVPFDAALKNGVIRHDSLRSSTQRAWLAAAAAVARGL